jgi:hypothetical protein
LGVLKERGMPDINETIVRHFFELNDFLVRTNVKYWYGSERGGGDSDIDLVVYNLSPDKLHPPTSFVLTVDEVPGLRQAIVETKGWHTESFTEGLIRNTPELFNFVRPEAIATARDKVFHDADFRRVLVLSRLSPVHANREAAIALLKEGGIDHVIEFDTIMRFTVDQVEARKNYPDSEILQTIRLLKVYGVIN